MRMDTLPQADDIDTTTRLAQGMHSANSLNSQADAHPTDALDPASLRLPPTHAIDLTASTRSDITVDEAQPTHA